MGRANALLKNLAVDKAIFNRLQGISIKATNLSNNNTNQIQYLFSLDILEASWDGSTLVFNKKTSTGENNISLIRFTDRPYRFDKHYVNEEAEIYIDNLFRENPEGFNSFSKDPPNGVLVVQSDTSLKGKQEAFEIKLRTVSNGKISMILNLLENQNNIEPFTNKPISLFIDQTNPKPVAGHLCRVKNYFWRWGHIKENERGGFFCYKDINYNAQIFTFSYDRKRWKWDNNNKSAQKL
jgi:hypothetical protein